ncbi:MAG: hypothetical protein GX234_10985 [Clostridiales bacterium]|nr:hypothetical protein [Clostridiales bacterium]
MQNSRTGYEAFEYVLNDISHVYIGARLTYGQLMERDDVPFKLRAILAHYMLKEVAEDTTVSDHLFFIQKNDLSYLAYKQMKAKFKLNIWQEAEERKKAGYTSRIYTIDEILADESLRRNRDITVVEEWSFKKFALVSVGL